MKLAVFSHKLCWPSAASPSGYATDGGFPLQMQTLSELFDATTLVVPVANHAAVVGEMPLTGRGLRIVSLTDPTGEGWRRKLRMLLWTLQNAPTLWRETRAADAVHVPIPGDVGTIGMLLAWLLGKPLFIRYCGNWLRQDTLAERFWRGFMEFCAGDRNVCLATGGTDQPPSLRNQAIRWIFSTSLTRREIELCATTRDAASLTAPRLVIACRQEFKKGTDVVLESLALLQTEFPELHFDVVGDGGALSEFKQLANRLEITGRVTFHGKVNHDRVIELLKQADLFCFPTTSSEGFPKAVLEAMACGLPVVTTRVSVLPQLLNNGGGVLLNEATPVAVAEAVRHCLSDPQRYRLMSERAVVAAQQYSLEHWRDTIGGYLRDAWGPLQSHS